ncbi:MAG: HTH domain-containing protein [Acetatifactor sp.]|nr:HTH domain-containing protein [Acetatifactor sp.]
MEALATGFKRIDEECSKAEVKYEFLKEEYGFTVRFHRHCGEGWNKDQDVSAKGPKKGPETKNDELALRCDAIIKEIKNNSKISRTVLAKELNITEKQVRTALEYLKNDGRIHYEGSVRGGHWVIDR